jgi:uroporphyrinogen decarboxylase
LSSTVTAQPFLAALRGERPAQRPIWLMRQAGRYLPEYRAVRARHSFIRMCQTPELACEITLQPIRRFGFDAAILFNDILVPLEPLGTSFAFTGEGPRLEHPLRDESDVAALRLFDPREELGYVAEAVRLIKRELNGTPLIGFAGAPFTLAAYLVEGGGSKDYRQVKALMYRRPDLFAALLEKLADTVAAYLRLQVEAGADAVQLFDSWAGVLAPADYARFELPAVQRIFAALADTGAPRLLFVKGGTSHLKSAVRSGADALSLDWTVDLADVAPRLDGLRLQGNLDPIALYAEPADIARRARAVCRAGDAAPGHVFNLGHGILPDTPLTGVEVLVEAVHAYRAENESRLMSESHPEDESRPGDESHVESESRPESAA